MSTYYIDGDIFVAAILIKNLKLNLDMIPINDFNKQFNDLLVDCAECGIYCRNNWEDHLSIFISDYKFVARMTSDRIAILEKPYVIERYFRLGLNPEVEKIIYKGIV